MLGDEGNIELGGVLFRLREACGAGAGRGWALGARGAVRGAGADRTLDPERWLLCEAWLECERCWANVKK